MRGGFVSEDFIPNRTHCPKCGNRAWQPYAEEYDELQGKGSWNPYYKWRVMGTCKRHGLVEIQDHDAGWDCLCGTVGDWDTWFGDLTETPYEPPDEETN